MFNIHTKESLTVTFKKDGHYEAGRAQAAQHFMRDWRRDKAARWIPS